MQFHIHCISAVIDVPRAAARRFRLPGERGQSMIELALFLPLILLLVLAVIDAGIAIDERATLQQSMRESGRAAIHGATPAQVVTAAVDNSSDVLESGDITVCYLDSADSGTYPGDKGDAVRVSFSHSYEVFLAKELLTAFGASPISFDMSPTGEAELLANVVGATSC